MEDWAGWVAPIATTIAACMTAANLGPRLTGWGFVVFSIGSIAWALVGYATGQQNLLWQNAVLLLINMIGVWRWLGRIARYDKGASHAAEASRAAAVPDLFAIGRVSGCPVSGRDGDTIGESIDAMAECATGRISYLVCSEGGIGGLGERLHAIPWGKVTAGEGGFAADLTAEELRALPVIDAEAWPARQRARAS